MRPIMSERELEVGWELAQSTGPVPLGVSMDGFRDRAAVGRAMRVFARPAVTVVIQFGDRPLTSEGVVRRSASDGLVAGLLPGIRHVHSERVECVELRMSPITAYRLLDAAPTDLDGTLIGLDDIWGSAAPLLRERLSESATWADRFAVTTKFLVAQESSRTADPEVVACWDRIVTDKGAVRVRELAELTGWSRKRVWSRFTAQVGVTPKRAAMVVRFRSAFELLLTGRTIAEAAVTCGYSDQSHLHRDMSTFAGVTPGALAAT
ncbi:helix-turn-helix domain-containing protein [Nocardia halotolerans]|uniref:Helix-turn-helix domain-containing protein n=1 Tax=Nocardia halotolerans TaxID=1755878 RepID=A0ABV8VAY7_9NOCA